MTKKIILGVLLIAILAGGIIGYKTYSAVFSPNTTETTGKFLDIKPGTDLSALADLMEEANFIKDKESFLYVAGLMKYQTVRSGRFSVPAGSSNIELIRHLRSSKQATVNLVLSNARTLEDLSGKIAKFIALDSTEILQYFNDGRAANILETNRENIMTYFIPNTYEVYWNESMDALLARMKKEHDRFWTSNNRLSKAENQNMSAEEIYTLASIIEKETNQNIEKPTMAAALHNRIRIGMPLQADPTAVFATGDFQTKRVLNKHTQYDSPYNTYMYKGLPPGPIAMASIASIDAVLSPDTNKYLYYCAKGDGSGLHNFATNLRAHNNNSRIYVQNLKRRGKR